MTKWSDSYRVLYRVGNISDFWWTAVSYAGSHTEMQDVARDLSRRGHLVLLEPSDRVGLLGVPSTFNANEYA